jgi:hypothetical protein
MGVLGLPLRYGFDHSQSNLLWFFLALPILYILNFVIVTRPERQNRQKLGSDAPTVPFWAPFGTAQ